MKTKITTGLIVLITMFHAITCFNIDTGFLMFNNAFRADPEVIDDETNIDVKTDNGGEEEYEYNLPSFVIDTGFLEIPGLFGNTNSILNTIDVEDDDEEKKSTETPHSSTEYIRSGTSMSSTKDTSVSPTKVTPRTTTMPDSYYKTLNYAYATNAQGKMLGVGPVDSVDAIEVKVAINNDRMFLPNVPKRPASTTTTTTTTDASVHNNDNETAEYSPFFDLSSLVLEEKGSGFQYTTPKNFNTATEADYEENTNDTNVIVTSTVEPTKNMVQINNEVNVENNFEKNNHNHLDHDVHDNTIQFQVEDNKNVKMWNKNISDSQNSLHYQVIKYCPSTHMMHFGSCVRLCGYPVFSNATKCNLLGSNGTLWDCSSSKLVALTTFSFLVLALAIILGNALVPLLIWKNKELRSRNNFIKVSLSTADIIIGFILICSVLPNIYSILEMHPTDLLELLLHGGNSGSAIVGGSALTLSAQASIMHLLFLSVERLIAIKWPLWHRTRKTSTLFVTLGGVWLWSVLVSLVPAMVPNEFEYVFSHIVFTPLMGTKNYGTSKLNIYGIIYGVITILLPYILTVICIATTGVIVWKKVTVSNNMQASSVLGHSRKRRQRNGEQMTGTDIVNRMRLRQKTKPDLVVFKTTIIMIVAFTVTILPFTIAVVMFFTGILNCDNYTVPYTVCFLASMSNSIANVMIYSIRDQNFRKAFQRTFAPKSVHDYADMWRSVTRKISNNPSGTTGTASTIVADHPVQVDNPIP